MQQQSRHHSFLKQVPNKNQLDRIWSERTYRQEAVEARNRQKERKQRTRRLIQQGAILENVFPEAQIMDLDNLKMELERRLSAEVTEKH